jgi:large subunit ribosomal protein L25
MAGHGTGTKQEKPVVAEIRKSRGSRASYFIRAEGKLPGIVYGMGKEPVAITLPASETNSVLRSGSHILEVQLEGKVEKMLIQAVGRDYRDTFVQHIDLMRIDPNQKVKVKVALEFRGTPKGAKEGGILETLFTDLEIEVPALAIPDSIRVAVDHLELHGVIHAKEIGLPSNAKLVGNPETIICTVRTVKEEVAAVAVEAGAAEPEVIGKKKEEEGAEGEAPAADAKGGAKAAAPAAKK